MERESGEVKIKKENPTQTEWTLVEKFFLRYTNLQSCESTDCVVEWSHRTGLDFQYVILREEGVSEELLDAFQRSSEFQLIYSNDGVSVFEPVST